MSVPKSKRKESAVEFDNNYFKVYDDCLMVCTNNFGYSRAKYAKKHAPKMVEYQTEEYNQALMARFEKKMDNLEIFLEAKKRQCAKTVEEILHHLKQANSIYPICELEYNERRLEQAKAIGCCYELLTQYQIAMRKADANQNNYVTVIENLMKEIHSIKKWRESDKSRFKQFKRKPQETQEVSPQKQ